MSGNPAETDEIFTNWANPLVQQDPDLAEQIVRSLVDKTERENPHCDNAEACNNMQVYYGRGYGPKELDTTE